VFRTCRRRALVWSLDQIEVKSFQAVKRREEVERMYRYLAQSDAELPELREVVGKAVHQPEKLADGVPKGYPEPMVDHAAERKEGSGAR